MAFINPHGRRYRSGSSGTQFSLGQQRHELLQQQEKKKKALTLK
jgi:hypothetical protein